MATGFTSEEPFDHMREADRLLAERGIVWDPREALVYLGDEMGVNLRRVSTEVAEEFWEHFSYQVADLKERFYRTRGARMSAAEWFYSPEADRLRIGLVHVMISVLFGGGES